MHMLKFAYTSMCFEDMVLCHSDIYIFHSKFSLDENKTITDGVIVCGLMWPSALTFIWSWKGECNCMYSEVGWAYFEVTMSIRL